MKTVKATIGNNSYIGAFAVATDSFVLITDTSTHTERSIIEDNLGVKSIGMTIDGSGLIGVYAVGNSKGILLPEMAGQKEIAKLKSALPDVEISTMQTSLNALKNNILANDKIAFVNNEYNKYETDRISDVLGVEVVKKQIGLYDTIGANNILTNKGAVLNNTASDEDIAFMKGRISSVSQSTANLGSSSIGLCVLANSNGLVVGNQTTGFEMVRITDGIDS
ncbi:MAG: translation initiation factor IF-6 [Candidatus Micrarchaeaceae archaeon]